MHAAVKLIGEIIDAASTFFARNAAVALVMLWWRVAVAIVYGVVVVVDVVAVVGDVVVLGIGGLRMLAGVEIVVYHNDTVGLVDLGVRADAA